MSDTHISVQSQRQFVHSSTALLCVWIGCAITSTCMMSSFEALHAAIILGLLILVRLACGSALSLSRNASGRLWTIGLFAATAVAISPLFLHSVAVKPPADALTWIAAILPLLSMLALTRLHKTYFKSNTPLQADGFEALLLEPRVRWNLAFVTVFVLGAGLLLSTTPLKMLLPRAVLVGSLLLALRALRDLSSIAEGARALQLISGASLAICAVFGLLRYGELQRKVEQADALLKSNQPENAAKLYSEAMALNDALLVKSAGEKMLMQRAVYHETRGEYENALQYLRELAGQRGVNPAELVAVHRVLCKQGESEYSWKRMILQGFKAVSDPELVPGIYALGDNPTSGLRPKLLAALLAWELGEPREEMIRRLEALQKIAPTDPSARSLLKRLGVKTAEGPMLLPSELMVTRKPNRTYDGIMDEIGEAETLAVLDKGTWELGVVAKATPLHEEWPIIRLELNGQTVARSQVTRIDFHEVPFTFVVNRTNLYSVRIVMENQREEVDGGHIMRRGLTIQAINLRHAP